MFGSFGWPSITGLLVLLFVIVLACARCSEANADEIKLSPYIELGQTVVNSSVTIGGIGVQVNNKWDVHAGLMGSGDIPDYGYQEQEFIFSASRIISPNWNFLGGEFRQRIGIAYMPDLQLVGPYNYRLGLMLDYDTIQIELGHYSSANINSENNKGVDFLSFRSLF